MWVYIVSCLYLSYNGYPASAAPSRCDPSHSFVQEGNLGQTSVSPWLGVLRVRLFQGNVFKIALSGIVLVKEGYAVINADDVARVPKRTLKSDGQAMFIPTPDTPWFCKVNDYMTHPEYQFSTMSTIALLELDPGDSIHYPMKPICWPSYSYNASNELYAFGYTDENKLLEKSLYKLQYVQLDICKEFYNRAGLTEGIQAPTNYLCGFAANNKENCLWDNGMVMASNTSGYWKLLGFGVKGPGCSAPARFIDMLSYFPWIESATDMYEIDDFRRYGSGFKKNRSRPIEDIPIHNVLRSGYRKNEPAEKRMGDHTEYPFDTETVQTRYFTVEKIEHGVTIWAENVTLPYKYGNCSNPRNKLIYTDDTKLVAKGGHGKASYKITAYDLHETNFTCIDIKLLPRVKGTATIYYAVEVDAMEGTSNAGYEDFGETPDELLKHFLIKKLTTEKPLPDDSWDPKKNPKLQAQFIKDTNYVLDIPNINILLRLTWEEEAHFMISIYTLGTSITTTLKPSSTFYTTYPPDNSTTATPTSTGNSTATSTDKSTKLTPNYSRMREKTLVVVEKPTLRETAIGSGSTRRETRFLFICLVFHYFYN